MSFNINSDKEFIRGSNPKLVGDNELTIRGGTGSLEREILRTQLDSDTGLPRVGINRTGQRVNTITIVGGAGYTSVPTVTIDPPTTPGGVQALASASLFLTVKLLTSLSITLVVDIQKHQMLLLLVVLVLVGELESVLRQLDFELDITGAIRTSTSIISDTARVLNLDIDNFVMT